MEPAFALRRFLLSCEIWLQAMEVLDLKAQDNYKRDLRRESKAKGRGM